MACFFGHKWNGCKCTKCGQLRDEGHDWNGCICRICGKRRSEGHDWQQPSQNKCFERCSICGQERRIEHDWNGCICKRCGQFQDEGHDWNSGEDSCIEKCSVCGKERVVHDFHPVEGKCEEKCARCGTVKTLEHQWQNGVCVRCGHEQGLDEKCVQLIFTLKNAADWKERRDAAKALSNYPNGESIKALIAAMKNDSEWVVRFSSADALGNIGNPIAVIPLTEALNDPIETVRQYVGKALGRIGDERGVEPMIAALAVHGNDYAGVHGIADGLGLMGEKAVPQLIKCLDTPERDLALRAFETYADKRVEDKLLAIACDPSESIYLRTRAVCGLGNIEGASCGEELSQLMQHAADDKLIKAIENTLAKLNYEVDASDKKKADRRAAEKMLAGLQAVHIGMTEEEADKLVGGAVFGMGQNQVHKTLYGDFQLLVNNGIVTGTWMMEGVIKSIEEYLKNEA